MALPIRPAGGLPSRPPVAEEPRVEKPAEALPEFSGLPSLPELPEPEPRREQRSPKQQAPRISRNTEAQAPETMFEEDSDWIVDPKTGKRFKPLRGFKEGTFKTPGAMRAFGNTEMTFSQLSSFVELNDDFSLDDLNGSADTFLAHLRVPPNKEEQAKLRRDRAERQKMFDAAQARAVEEENKFYHDEN